MFPFKAEILTFSRLKITDYVTFIHWRPENLRYSVYTVQKYIWLENANPAIFCSTWTRPYVS